MGLHSQPVGVQAAVPLAPYTTFKIGGKAAYLALITDEAQLTAVVSWAKSQALPILVLGGGSNVLVSDDGVAGVVCIMQTKGVAIIAEDDTQVTVQIAAGEVWDEVVQYAVTHGWWGIENLSAIPGSVGATPVQNVGAYGVEVSSVISKVQVYDIDTQTIHTLENDACLFGYRDSVFKHQAGKDLIVLAVTVVLSKKPQPQIQYKDLQLFFADVRMPTLTDIRAAVQTIRAKKFPDLTRIGTAGSFFKNPIISMQQAALLQVQYPELPVFPMENNTAKISISWILDKVCGLKGYRHEHVGTHDTHVLVVTADAQATACDVQKFAQDVAKHVQEKTGIHIEWEVRYLQ